MLSAELGLESDFKSFPSTSQETSSGKSGLRDIVRCRANPGNKPRICSQSVQMGPGKANQLCIIGIPLAASQSHMVFDFLQELDNHLKIWFRFIGGDVMFLKASSNTERGTACCSLGRCSCGGLKPCHKGIKELLQVFGVRDVCLSLILILILLALGSFKIMLKTISLGDEACNVCSCGVELLLDFCAFTK
jgi:hypothetical protein